MIPHEHRDAVVTSGISFMQALSEAYGVEQGLALFETISQTLDPDVKGQIWMAMIRGDFQCRIVITGAVNHDRVAMIKALRNATGWGIKEAKDAVFDLIEKGKHISVQCTRDMRYTHTHTLRNVGLVC